MEDREGQHGGESSSVNIHVDWWLEVLDWNLEEGFEGVDFMVLGV